jgi:Ca2+-binding RTX toxin-like protein
MHIGSLPVRLVSVATIVAISLLAQTQALPSAQADVPGPTYENDFEDAAGPEWPSSALSVAPSGNQYLGRFGNQTVTLALGTLPPHTEITILFNLYIVDSWDGHDNNFGSGPDRWKFAIDGSTLLDTAFANVICCPAPFEQAFPDNYPANNPPKTDAAFFDPPGDPGTSVYQFSYTIPHGDSNLQVAFTGSGLQSLVDESWGIDNVKVTVAGAPTLSPWEFDNSMTQARAHSALAATATAVYVSGGGIASQGLAHTNSVEYATIAIDGDLGVWNTTAPMATVRTLLGMTSIGGALIVAGGQTGDADPLSSTEIATPNPDSSITSWAPGPALNKTRSGLRMVTHDECVYVVGGGNSSGSLSQIEAATVNFDGSGNFVSLNPWSEFGQTVPALGSTRPIPTATHLYLVIATGTLTTGTYTRVYRAPFIDGAEDCALGAWESDVAPAISPTIGNTAAVLSHGRLYLLGGVVPISGSSATTQNAVWSAPMNPDGTFGAWVSEPWLAEPPMQERRDDPMAIAIGPYLYALGGNDSFSGWQHYSSVERAAFFAGETCDGLPATIVGTPGDDVIVGLAGVDDIHGNGGNDTICGGPGNDNLVGQDGDDHLFGNDGNDRIYGLDGEDYVEGGDGDDVIYGGNDNDSLHGNAGDDRLKGEAGVDEVDGDEGNDTVQGGDDNDLLYGGPNDDRLYGGNGNDTMLGGDGYNVYYGGPGDDTITGGADIDRMKGEAGTDTCDGAGGLADTAQTCEIVLNVP